MLFPIDIFDYIKRFKNVNKFVFKTNNFVRWCFIVKRQNDNKVYVLHGEGCEYVLGYKLFDIWSKNIKYLYFNLCTECIKFLFYYCLFFNFTINSKNKNV